VVQPRFCSRRARRGVTVQYDQWYVPVSERRVVLVALLDDEAERSFVPGDRAIEIDHCEVHRAETEVVGERCLGWLSCRVGVHGAQYVGVATGRAWTH
jgi:hypothetical protein